jgi:hypothetical protein
MTAGHPAPQRDEPTMASKSDTPGNVIYVLHNGEPGEYAYARNVKSLKTLNEGTLIARFINVPDDIMTEIEDGGGVKHVWDDLFALPDKSIEVL